MFKFTHVTLVYVCGLIWLMIGCILLPMGLNFIVEAILKDSLSLAHPVLGFFAPYVGGLDQAVLTWIVLSLIIGICKGRYVFAKAVQRNVNRILSLPTPVSLLQIYPAAFYLLLVVMAFLGFIMQFTPFDVRGGVDVAVGSALISGSLLYFRHARLMQESRG
jgi:hypothetical protein